MISSDRSAGAPLAKVRVRRSRAIDRLAVLPLVNASADPETDYFSDGITESIISSLSQLPGLRVMARSTVFRYKGREVDSQIVGRELNVRAVVSGRILPRGDSVVLGLELVDVEDGAQLWSCYYNREMEEIFNLQEQIATEISDKLRLRLTGAQKKRLTKRHTQNTDAYQLYLKGRYFWARRTPEGLQKSMEYFERAIEIDPDYSLASVGLADAYLVMQWYNVLPPPVARPKARAAVKRALEIDESLAEAHTSLGAIYSLNDWRWEGGEQEFRRAIELNPNYPTAHHWYGAINLSPRGRHDESIASLKRALELDPFSLIINTHLGLVIMLSRDYARAREQLTKTLEMDPNFPEAHLYLASTCWLSGHRDEGIAEIKRASALSPNDTRMLAYLAQWLAMAGEKSEAEACLRQLLEKPGSQYVSPCLIAIAYFGFGDVESFHRYLDKAFEERSPSLVFSGVWPDFDPLRTDPRFADLLRRMGLPP